MKKELPIAVILLAVGAWCCFQFPADTSAVNARVASGIDFDSGQFRSTGVGSVVQTSWESPAVEAQPVEVHPEEVHLKEVQPEETSSTEQQLDSMRAFPPVEFLKIANSADAQATNSIRKIATGMNQSPAFATHTKINSLLFGVALAANGKYFQTTGGQKSRMEVQCHSPVAQTVLQMCDGRFVYILKSTHQKQRLEFIDLFRLGNNRGQAQGGLLPTTWVMGGGIGDAIMHYAEAFDFQAVAPSLEGRGPEDMMTFRGIWKAGTLLHLLNAGESLEERPTSVQWAKVPRQLPHAIELTFATTAGQPAVPRQISFFQFQTSKTVSTAKEIVRIEFSPFEFKNNLPDELFTLESTDFEAVDVTNDYNAKIKKLSEGMDKVADQAIPADGLR